MRYTKTTKTQLATVIDYLIDDGHEDAAEKIMKRLHLSPEELNAWRNTDKVNNVN